jgi:hypothetical protein
VALWWRVRSVLMMLGVFLMFWWCFCGVSGVLKEWHFLDWAGTPLNTKLASKETQNFAIGAVCWVNYIAREWNSVGTPFFFGTFIKILKQGISLWRQLLNLECTCTSTRLERCACPCFLGLTSVSL